MDIKDIAELIEQGCLQWKRHALERMMERGILRSSVKHILVEGKIIEQYPDDKPFPSCLILGFLNENPLHVVVGLDQKDRWCYIITVYRPDFNHFEQDFKTRKQ